MRKFRLVVYSGLACAVVLAAALIFLARGILSPEQKAFDFYRSGNFGWAKSELEQIQVESPDESITAFNLGVVSHRQGDFKAAKSSFLNAVNVDDKDKEFCARCYTNAGNCDFNAAFSGKVPEKWFDDANFIGQAIEKLESAVLLYGSALECNQEDSKASENLKKAEELLELLRKRLKDLDEKNKEKNDGKQDQNGASDQQKQDQSGSSGQKGDQSQSGESSNDGDGQGADGDRGSSGDKSGKSGDKDQDMGSQGSGSKDEMEQSSSKSGANSPQDQKMDKGGESKSQSQESDQSSDKNGMDSGSAGEKDESMEQGNSSRDKEMGSPEQRQSGSDGSQGRKDSARDRNPSGRQEMGRQAKNEPNDNMEESGQDSQSQQEQQEVRGSGSDEKDLGSGGGQSGEELGSKAEDSKIPGAMARQSDEKEATEKSEIGMAGSGKNLKDRSIESLVKALASKDAAQGKSRMRGKLGSPSSAKGW